MTPRFTRLMSLVLFFALSACLVFPANTGTGEEEYEPYSGDEFNPVLKDIRRAEIIAFGSFPFVVFFSTVYYDVYRYFSHNMQDAYLPWPFKDASTAVSVSENEQKMLLFTSMGISVGIALFDFVFRTVFRNMKEKKAEEEARENIHPIQIRPLIRAKDESIYPQPPVPDSVPENSIQITSGAGDSAS